MIDPEEKIRRVELMPPNPEWATQFENAASEIKAMEVEFLWLLLIK